MSKLKDLTGLRFGRLSVLRRSADRIQRNGRRIVLWECICDCGNMTVVAGDNLKSGRTQSCGCFRAETASARSSTHHETDTRLYGVWSAIKARCYNKNTKYYSRYGARGIGVCPEWRNSFEAFRDWAISTGYEDGLTIDREDNDRGYSPDNCRWVTSKVQANNRSSNRLLTYDGETHNVTEWASIKGVNPKTLFSRIYAGYSDEDVLKL